MCLLDDEKTVVRGTMRATGDWVQVRNSRLYFLGRKDRLVKRFGQRVHLDALQQVRTPQVSPNKSPRLFKRYKLYRGILRLLFSDY